MGVKIVFIGSNPSQKSKSIVPFWYDTKSNAVLSKWMSEVHKAPNITIEAVYYFNVANHPTPGNRPLKTSEIHAGLINLDAKLSEVNPDRIIALGKTAEKALTLLRKQFLAMPHPSGMNRQLNDPAYVAEKIKALQDYLTGPLNESLISKD